MVEIVADDGHGYSYQFSTYGDDDKKLRKEYKRVQRKIKRFYKKKQKEDANLYRLIIFLYVYYSNRELTRVNVISRFQSSFLVSYLDLCSVISYYYLFNANILNDSRLFIQMVKVKLSNFCYLYNLTCLNFFFYCSSNFSLCQVEILRNNINLNNYVNNYFKFMLFNIDEFFPIICLEHFFLKVDMVGFFFFRKKFRVSKSKKI